MEAGKRQLHRQLTNRAVRIDVLAAPGLTEHGGARSALMRCGGLVYPENPPLRCSQVQRIHRVSTFEVSVSTGSSISATSRRLWKNSIRGSNRLPIRFSTSLATRSDRSE